MTQAELSAKLPQGQQFGLKQPYLKNDSTNHQMELRNDNSQNLVFKLEKGYENPVDLKNEGNQLYLQKKYCQAIRCYEKALELADNDELRVQLLSNLA